MSQDLNFTNFSTIISDLYSVKNSEREFEEIYSYLCRNTSYLSRAILRGGDAKSFFIKSFSWLFAAANKLDINLEHAFRKKFPNVCPYCIASPCQCAETHRAPVKHIPIDEVRVELNDKYNIDINRYPQITLDQAISRISLIYPANKSIWKAFGSFYHFSRVFEELGEVHEAFSSYKKNGKKVNLEEELADVTAWMLSAWAIHQYPLQLSHAIKDYYADNCPICKSSPCECNKYSDRSQMLSDSKSLKEVKEKITELLGLDPDYKKEIQDVLSSFDSAISTASTVDAKQVITSARQVLKDLEESIESASADGGSEKIKNAIQEVYSSIDTNKYFWK
ncbi:hypothetical protein [Pseudomonas sp. SDO52101_S400]